MSAVLPPLPPAVLSLFAAKRQGIKERRNNPSEKRFILVKSVLPAVTPAGTWQAVAYAFFRANLSARIEREAGKERERERERERGREREGSFGCSGGRGKLDVQRRWGAFRNLPRTSRSAKCTRTLSAEYIQSAVSRVTAFSKRITVDRRMNAAFRRLPPSGEISSRALPAAIINNGLTIR